MTVQVLGFSCWNKTLLLPSPDVLPEHQVPAGLGVSGLQWHSRVSDSPSTVSAESQTLRIIYFGKASKTIESLPQLEEKGETVAVWRLKENPPTHLSRLEVMLGRLHAAQKKSVQPSPFQSGKSAVPKLPSMIHHFVLPAGNCRGGGMRWEEGVSGRLIAATPGDLGHCRYFRRKKVIFNSKWSPAP